MKRIFLLFCLLPVAAQALDRPQLDKLLASAASVRGQSYLEARRAILDLGKDASPLLTQAASDPKLRWQQRLVARICYERTFRGDEIEALRRYDWRKHPQYDKRWEMSIVGARIRLGTIAVPKLVDAGLWYYYIELAWKGTEEYAVEPFNPMNDTRILSESWLGWCMDAVRGQPEGYYLVEALAERLELDASLSEPIDVNYYWHLLLNKETNAVPVLVKQAENFVRRSGPSTLTPGEVQTALEFKLEKIMPFADSRHVDLIARFIEEHPALVSLKEKLAAVRARAAQPLAVEPPFRLDHQAPITP